MSKTFRNLATALALVWAASTIYSTTAIGQSGITEAPTGFDNLTNGFVTQLAFDAARATFEEHEELDEGLGPVYNADSCAGCHANSLTGAISQVTELRAGRFGWKNQHASLLSFAADAYLNEMGITSPLQPTENTSNGLSVAAFDDVLDPEDDGTDLEAFALFMRATKAPPRDAAIAGTADAVAGSNLFDSIGCGSCHVRNIVTAPPGTSINGGALTVHAALGNKRIHPFSDFLMHDVVTGDGIVQNGGQGTRNQLRTPPLWGLRSKGRLMHDGESLTRNDAILRHAGQATGVINSYRNLSTASKNQLIAFLNSL